MSYINLLLHKIINNKCDFCCLCFTTVIQPTHFEDEVRISDNASGEHVEVAEILTYIFSKEIFQTISAFDALCNNCLTSAINSYKFIKETKQSTEYLFNAVEHLTNCFEHTPQDLHDTKTLFVALNPDLCTSNQYYDNIGFVSTRAMASKRFQTVIDLENIEKEQKPSPKEVMRNKNIGITIKSDPERANCSECSASFISQRKLRNHHARVHGPKTLKCPDCHEKFSSEIYLTRHRSQKHLELICSECGKMFRTKQSLRLHKKTHYLRLVCQDCGRIYKNRNTFNKHFQNNICQRQMRHSPADAKFTCDYCQKKYSQKMTLRVHIQYEHLGYKYLQCKSCDKKFYCQSRLNAHSVKHTKERNFPCSICNGKFVTKESLLYHTRIHTGERPYPCPHCDSRFLSASRRVAHIKSYHIEPTVECDICHNKFKSQNSLIKHKKSHNVTRKLDHHQHCSVIGSYTEKNINKNSGTKKEGLIYVTVNEDRLQSIKQEVEVELQPMKNDMKFYYEVASDGKLCLHTNPSRLQILADSVSREVVQPDNSKVQYVFEVDGQERDRQTGDRKLYQEVSNEDENYVLKVSENVEV